MPKGSKVEECMFCGEMHAGLCGSQDKPKKAAAKKKAVKFSENPNLDRTVETVDLLDEGKSSIRAAMKAAAESNPQSNIETFTEASRGGYVSHVQELLPQSTVPEVRDTEFDEAIRVLLEAEMLHPEEVTQYDFLLRPQGGVQQGLDEWKSWYAGAIQAKRVP